MISAERLREVLNFDPETGVFVRRIRCGPMMSGVTAGTLNTAGYVVIRIGGLLYYAHRLAWLHVHGEWPFAEIDHINGDRSDNRLINLRDVSHATNQQNIRQSMTSNRSSGLLGVTWFRPRGKWQAQITFNGRHRCLGLFTTPEAAHAAYVEAKRRLHQGCTM